MSPNAGGGEGVAGSQPMSTAVHRSPNKLWRSNSIFNLWKRHSGHVFFELGPVPAALPLLRPAAGHDGRQCRPEAKECSKYMKRKRRLGQIQEVAIGLDHHQQTDGMIKTKRTL